MHRGIYQLIGRPGQKVQTGLRMLPLYRYSYFLPARDPAFGPLRDFRLA